MLKHLSLLGSAGAVLCTLAQLLGFKSLVWLVATVICAAVSFVAQWAWNITRPEDDSNSMQRSVGRPVD